ncbi:lecithin retinol acyltransferase [Morus notabilis]|uniref:lecithin retinol acyltransferase n=1 Tax=Morus notabilis TaxID=981085 RepID=UPI000CED2AF9|nr:lecithin retinol acyltransferase [Morus notabilis]
MGLFSNRIDRSLLKPGDHVYCYRNNHIYSHHGIYVGDNKVIHLTRTQVDGQNDNDHNPMISCQVCKHEPKRSGVVKCCLDCFLKGHKLFRFKYGISSTQFVMNRSGTCSTGNCCYSRDDVVRRATDMLHSSEGFGAYNLLNNNCEAFAVYCKTGKRLSLQAFSLRNKVEVTFDELTSQPFSAKKVPKIVFKSVVRHKKDMLRYDRAKHQQDNYDHGDKEDYNYRRR